MSRRQKLEKMFNYKEVREEEDFDDYMDEEELKKYKDKGIKGDIKKNDALRKEMAKYKGKKVNYEDIGKQGDSDDEIEDDLEDLEGEEGEDDLEDLEGDEIEDDLEGDDIEDDLNGHDQSDNIITNNPKNGKFEASKEQMNKEDEEYIKKISSQTPNEIKKGKNVINQKNLFDFLVGIRISLQKMISSINILPESRLLNKFVNESNSHLVKTTINSIVKLYINIVSFHKELLLKGNLMPHINRESETDTEKELNRFLNKIAEKLNRESYSFEADEVFSLMNKIYEKVTKVSERIIDIWYRKTLVYSFKATTGNKMLKILSNNFCEHIKSNVESNFSSLKEKTSKIKQNEGKIIGKRNRSNEDEEIYNDGDFYAYLLKEFISSKENEVKTDASGNRYDLTLQYLMNRNKDKKSKNVDSKATKNRKLRFDKHEKIINFMVPLANYSVNTGRDEIVRSVFNLNKKEEEVDSDNDVDII
jgi:protein AATF/BFR2